MSFSIFTLVYCFFYFNGLAVATIIFDPVHNTCGPNAATGGSLLLQDVVTMGAYASKLMEDAANGNFQQNPWEFHRLMRTYNSFFDGQLSDSQSRYDDIKGKLQIMGNLGSNSPNVFVACDDSPFWDTSDPSVLIFHDPETNTDEKLNPGQIVTCESGKSKGQMAYRTNINNVAYIMLCLKQLAIPETFSSLTNVEGDILDHKRTLSAVLFHEMLHAVFPDMRGDQAGGNAVGGERYSWLGTQEVRSTYGNENPDSLTLFATALAHDEFLWDTGMAESKATRYLRLQAEGNVLNLPVPT